LGAKIFESLEEKREYVRSWLIARGQWYEKVSIMPETIHPDTSPDLLHSEMPVGRLDVAKGGVSAGEAGRGEASQEPDRPIVNKNGEPLFEVWIVSGRDLCELHDCLWERQLDGWRIHGGLEFSYQEQSWSQGVIRELTTNGKAEVEELKREYEALRKRAA
jgi:hypothetical protein